MPCGRRGGSSGPRAEVVWLVSPYMTLLPEPASVISCVRAIPIVSRCSFLLLVILNIYHYLT
jgi:hypothetical protein